MRLVTLASLVWPACGSVASEPPPRPAPPPVLSAPEPPEWPADLPEARVTEGATQLAPPSGPIVMLDPGTVVVPPRTAHAAATWESEMESYPDACAFRLGQQRALGVRHAERVSEVERAHCATVAAQAVADAGGWAWWEVGLLAGGTALGGFLLGALAAWVGTL